MNKRLTIKDEDGDLHKYSPLASANKYYINDKKLGQLTPDNKQYFYRVVATCEALADRSTDGKLEGRDQRNPDRKHIWKVIKDKFVRTAPHLYIPEIVTSDPENDYSTGTDAFEDIAEKPPMHMALWKLMERVATVLKLDLLTDENKKLAGVLFVIRPKSTSMPPNALVLSEGCISTHFSLVAPKSSKNSSRIALLYTIQKNNRLQQTTSSIPITQSWSFYNK